MVNGFDMGKYMDNLLTEYRDRDVEHYDPTRLQRQNDLSQYRGQELGRQEDILNRTYGRNRNILGSAYGLMNAGAVQKGVQPQAAARPYIRQEERLGSGLRDVSDKRIAGARRDEERISNFVDEAQQYTMGQEQTDYKRDQAAKDRQFQREQFDFRKSEAEKSRQLAREKMRYNRASQNKPMGFITRDDGSRKLVYNIPDPQTGVTKPMIMEGGRMEEVTNFDNFTPMQGGLGTGTGSQTKYYKPEVVTHPETGEKFSWVPSSGPGETGNYVYLSGPKKGQPVTDTDIVNKLPVPGGEAPGQLPSSVREGLGDYGVEKYKQADKTYKDSTQRLQTLDRLEQTLADPRNQGRVYGSETMQMLQGVAEDLGMQGLSNRFGNLSDKERTSANVGELVVQLRQGLQGQGQISDQEQNMLYDQLPTSTNTQAANKATIDVLRNKAIRERHKAQFYRQNFKKYQGDPTSIEQAYRRQYGDGMNVPGVKSIEQIRDDAGLNDSNTTNNQSQTPAADTPTQGMQGPGGGTTRGQSRDDPIPITRSNAHLLDQLPAGTWIKAPNGDIRRIR